MAKKVFLVLGNGFSIDFLKHISEFENIDLVNLFRQGSAVPWPVDAIPGFLSFKYCPNLWNLGARPSMTSIEAMALIEDIITCVNVYASRERKDGIGEESKPNYIYLRAYMELLQYLRHLFVFNNKKLIDIPSGAEEWAWFKYLAHASEDVNVERITIVTYNYDIWLERLLQRFGVPFSIGVIGQEVPDSKITILKPHGSISFTHKQKIDISAFNIKQELNWEDGASGDFDIRYDELDQNYLITALIPPAGESSRFNHSWAKQIREEAKRNVSELDENDELFLCGLSYWHVDRAELDELIVNCDTHVNVVMVNPAPQRSITAVLASVFSNFVTYPSSDLLKERIK